MAYFSLKEYKENLHNYIWFRLSKIYKKHFTTYTVNSVVDNILTIHRQWNRDYRLDLQDIAAEMFEQNGFQRFEVLAKELQDPKIEIETFLAILYLCVQVTKLYIEVREIYAVKYFILEMEKNIDIALQSKVKKENKNVLFV